MQKYLKKIVVSKLYLKVLFLLLILAYLLQFNFIYAQNNENLGLIVKYIEVVEDKPLIAAIFNTKTQKTIEYTIGDYVEGKLVKDILEDRVILYDEITRYQYVLLLNDFIFEEENEDKDTKIIWTKTKRRENEDMNITNLFNIELSRVQGKEFPKYGAPDTQQNEELKLKMNQYVRTFLNTTEVGLSNYEIQLQEHQNIANNKVSSTTEIQTIAEKNIQIKTNEIELKSTNKITITKENELKNNINNVIPKNEKINVTTNETNINNNSNINTTTKISPKLSNDNKSDNKQVLNVIKTSDGTVVRIREKTSPKPTITEDK